MTHGSPFQHILCPRYWEDDLVIMATHGRTAPLRWALGSVADRVTRGGAAAVLLVRVGVAPGTAAGDA